LLYLLAYPEGESLNRFLKAEQQNAGAETGGGVFHLPELESVVRVFPNDRKLTELAKLTDFNYLRNEALPAVVTKGFGEEWKIAGLNIELVQYAAERACTVRADLELRSQLTGKTNQQVIFGKTYCADEGSNAWQLLSGLWQSEARQSGRLLIPRPLAYQPEIKTIWQSGLAGVTLNEFDCASAEFPALLEKAGDAVAALHQSPIQTAPHISHSDLISKLEAAEKLIGSVAPSLRSKLHNLIIRLADAPAKFGSRPPVTLHGDLHLKNLFVSGNRVALIDLDNVALGDPLLDVGSFVAGLQYREILEGNSFRESIARFVKAYRARAGWEVSEFALRWHTAAALVYERAYRCITRLKPGRLEVLDEIIDLADQTF